MHTSTTVPATAHHKNDNPRTPNLLLKAISENSNNNADLDVRQELPKPIRVESPPKRDLPTSPNSDDPCEDTQSDTPIQFSKFLRKKHAVNHHDHCDSDAKHKLLCSITEFSPIVPNAVYTNFNKTLQELELKSLKRLATVSRLISRDLTSKDSIKNLEAGNKSSLTPLTKHLQDVRLDSSQDTNTPEDNTEEETSVHVVDDNCQSIPNINNSQSIPNITNQNGNNLVPELATQDSNQIPTIFLVHFIVAALQMLDNKNGSTMKDIRKILARAGLIDSETDIRRAMIVGLKMGLIARPESAAKAGIYGRYVEGDGIPIFVGKGKPKKHKGSGKKKGKGSSKSTKS